MTEEHDHDMTNDLTAKLPDDELERIEELSPQTPIDAAKSVAAGDVPKWALPLAGGGLLLVSALRSVLKGQLRAIPKAAAGAGLLRYGLGKRRADSSASSAPGSDETSTFEPANLEDVEGGTEGKAMSDEAATATGSPEGVDIDETGEIPDEANFGEEDSGARIEFVDDDGTPSADEPHSTPDLDEGTEDPRLDDEDDDVEIDLSQSATAEEASEAAGPSPGQAQPAQTDTTEPEETPEEDASNMKVDPDPDDDDEDEELESGTGDTESSDETDEEDGT